MSDIKQTWTVWIIMVHDGEHFFEIADLEQSRLDVKKYKSIRYVIYLYDVEFQTATVRTIALVDGVYTFKQVASIQEIDILDDATLTVFFQKHQTNYGTTEKNMVITWGHGAGLGYYSRLEKELINYFKSTHFKNEAGFQIEKRKANLTLNAAAQLAASLSVEIPSEILLNHFFPEGSEFINQPHIQELFSRKLKCITAKRLADILLKSFNAKPIDVLLTINCYTQLIECGYEFLGSVELLISPQTTIPFAGINYRQLFREMESNPAIGLKQISENVTVNFHEKYRQQPFLQDFIRRYPGFYQFYFPQISISCNLIAGYNKLLTSIEPLILHFCSAIDLTVQNEKWIRILSNARNKCVELAPNDSHGIIDLEHFLDEVINDSEMDEPGLRQYLDAFKEEKVKYNLSILKADEIYYKPDANNASMSPFFISAFFPYKTSAPMVNALVDLYFKGRATNRFQQSSKWDDFIELMYRHY